MWSATVGAAGDCTNGLFPINYQNQKLAVETQRRTKLQTSVAAYLHIAYKLGNKLVYRRLPGG